MVILVAIFDPPFYLNELLWSIRLFMAAAMVDVNRLDSLELALVWTPFINR